MFWISLNGLEVYTYFLFLRENKTKKKTLNMTLDKKIQVYKNRIFPKNHISTKQINQVWLLINWLWILRITMHNKASYMK